MSQQPSITDWITAGSTLGGAAITAVSVVVAAWVGIRTLRQTKRDSISRSRPMVVATLERDPHPTGLSAFLVVENYGQSVAYNVTVTFDPPIHDVGTQSGQPSFVPMLLRRYAEPIANLAPGVALRSIWNIPNRESHGENSRYPNDEPIPDRVLAMIRYSDRPGFWNQDAHRYTETFVLDIEILRGDVIVSHSDDQLGLLKRSTKALEGMAADVRAATKLAANHVENKNE